MSLARLRSYLRRPWPYTHLLVRGASHCALSEVLEVIAQRRRIAFVFGLASKAGLRRQAAQGMQEARALCRQPTAVAHAYGEQLPARRRLYAEGAYAAASWGQPWRVLRKAEGMAAGDQPRLVVTSCAAPPPPQVYADLDCARGHGENDMKAVKGALPRDRTAATTWLANAVRLLRACGAYGLHPALRTHPLPHTGLATAQPGTGILTLCKVAPQSTQSKDRVLPQLPTSCPVKALGHRGTTLLPALPVPALPTS